MTTICFYFQVHQPFRLRDYRFNEIGINHDYEDAEKNKAILNKVADKCYLPANARMLELIKRTNGRFRISYSISGVALEQFEMWRPDVIESFRALVNTGCVEILSETYYHSLSFLYSKDEFNRQIRNHAQKVNKLFGVVPVVFRNTELIFNNEIAHHVAGLGYKGMLCEGVDRILHGRSPNHVYAAQLNNNFGLLLKNYKLSDDIAFRFSDKNWVEYPLTANKFANWVHRHAAHGEVINLFMDYETFGEHQWKETGIFDFLEALPAAIFAHPHFNFKTPLEVLETYSPRDTYDVPHTISWADAERDLSAWNENKMQHHALQRVYKLGRTVRRLNDPLLLHLWGKLTTSDHFYYMSTKYWSDGDVHKYFSPYSTPYDAHIFYMNALSDFEEMLKERVLDSITVQGRELVA